MELWVLGVGIALLGGFLAVSWLFTFLFSKDDHNDSDWYSEDEGL
jgi:hypothetical protein